MTRTRNMSDLLDSGGDVKSSALDNVPASNDASALTTGTLAAARLPAEIVSSDTTPQLGGNLDTNGNNINFGDNDKAQFGASNDLQIYHQGSHSFVEDTGTGNLYLATNGSSVRITKGPQNAENMAAFIPDGAAILYYDNAGKIATTSTGIDVTGDVLADTVTLDNGANDWQFSVDASNNLIISIAGTAKAKLDSSGNLTVVGDVTAFGTI